VDVFRGCCEALALILFVVKGIFEIYHIALYRMKFLTGYLFFIFNYMALVAVVFILIIIPLRITGSDVQWVFAALAYILQGLATFKFTLVVR